MRFANAPEINGPRDLPTLRLWVQRQWEPGALFSTAADMADQVPQLNLDNDTFPSSARFDRERISQAGLYYVTSDIVEIVQHAASTLPPTTLTEELLPEPMGFMWLEKPLEGVSALEPGVLREVDGPLLVSAMLWAPARIRGFDQVLGIGLYGLLPAVDQEHPMLFPMGRTDWRWGDNTEEPIIDAISGDARRVESMAEDRRFLATLLLLMGQKNLAEVEEVVPSRPVRRRSEQAKVSSTVRVVNVRSRARAAVEQPSEHRQVNWTHRWVVGWPGGFWRQQAYGPNRSLRRPTLVLPFQKGPADKPLVFRETVRVLKDNGTLGEPSGAVDEPS